MSKTQFPKADYLKHNTRGCWLLPDGQILDNPKFDTPDAKKAYQDRIRALNGWFFDSKHEARTFWARTLELKAGAIFKLTRKFKIPLVSHGGTVVSSLETDITYCRAGKFVVEDAKGSDFQCTPDWKLKWAWAKADNPDWEFVITYQESYLKSLEWKQWQKLHKKQLKSGRPKL